MENVETVQFLRNENFEIQKKKGTEFCMGRGFPTHHVTVMMLFCTTWVALQPANTRGENAARNDFADHVEIFLRACSRD